MQTTRGIFLIFLLYQLTIASPGREVGGVQTIFTDYIKFIPKKIPLTTFYSPEEKELLVGTSLSNALEQKIRGLEREFEMLRERTKELGWARKAWWGLGPEGDEDGSEGSDLAPLRLRDWKLVDAIYRSRALELPEERGVVMVPVLDMANHGSEDEYNARFESDKDGNVMLIVREGRTIQAGDEVKICYGAGGACESIFSYGFLDHDASSARELYLSLSVPADDPLRLAKMRVAQTAPTIRLYIDQNGKTGWESDFVWWACINEEDGLDFQVLQSNDGQKELKATWKGDEFEPYDLKRLVLADERRDVFNLRSLVLVQQRIEQQGDEMADNEARFDAAKHATGVGQATWELISRLRSLELELLTGTFEMLETEVGLDSANKQGKSCG